MLIFTRYRYWVGSMLVMAAVLAVLGRQGLLNPAQDVFLTVTGPIERGLSGTFQPVANLLADVRDLDRLQNENRGLLLENEALRNEVAKLQGDAQRVADLEGALIPGAVNLHHGGRMPVESRDEVAVFESIADSGDLT